MHMQIVVLINKKIHAKLPNISVNFYTLLSISIDIPEHQISANWSLFSQVGTSN